MLQTAPVPSAPRRAIQRLAAKAGLLDWQRRWLDPLVSERTQAQLAGGPPRFLVRVDEFPYATSFDQPERYGLEASRRFHEVMTAGAVSHLMAIVPQLTHAPLDPGAVGGRPLDAAELEHIETMRRDGVAFAQHGTTHRTRNSNPRRRSELVGLSPAEAGELLDRGRKALGAIGISPRVFVPPFNTFEADHWTTLSERYDVICGGPESVALLGWQPGPLWREDAVYLPCYPPLYGRARDLLVPTAKLIERAPGTWIPLVLHLGWEADDSFVGLRALAEQIAPHALDWDRFLADVDRSRVTR
jgi:hypothetical protein